MWAFKYYTCEHCGSDFISCTALRYHFQQKHLGKVRCEKCGYEVLREELQDPSEPECPKDFHLIACWSVKGPKNYRDLQVKKSALPPKHCVLLVLLNSVLHSS
ncbi:hypothetical protein MUG91_G5n242 [Manis pentadactyla]|nr:hypothetical protein MUG91_G5n242 [Manis pentadactyla]